MHLVAFKNSSQIFLRSVLVTPYLLRPKIFINKNLDSITLILQNWNKSLDEKPFIVVCLTISLLQSVLLFYLAMALFATLLNICWYRNLKWMDDKNEWTSVEIHDQLHLGLLSYNFFGVFPDVFYLTLTSLRKSAFSGLMWWNSFTSPFSVSTFTRKSKLLFPVVFSLCNARAWRATTVSCEKFSVW